jgi:hypothetical protein
MLVPLLEESAIAQRLRRRVLDDQEVLTRCLAALVHGAAKLIEDGVVLDAAEIDRLWNRLGFPRWRGGLLYAFSRGGLPDLAALWRGSPPPRNTLGAPCALLQSWMMGGDPLARAEFGEKVGALKSQRH